MKAEIHPEWFADATVTCGSCGTTFEVGATVPEINTEICSACHPFYTGQQRIVDTAGQVERFMRRLQAGQEHRESEAEREKRRQEEKLEARRKRRGLEPIAAKLSDEDGESNGEDGDQGDSETS